MHRHGTNLGEEAKEDQHYLGHILYIPTDLIHRQLFETTILSKAEGERSPGTNGMDGSISLTLQLMMVMIFIQRYCLCSLK
jgi:hypothetical protein